MKNKLMRAISETNTFYNKYSNYFNTAYSVVNTINALPKNPKISNYIEMGLNLKNIIMSFAMSEVNAQLNLGKNLNDLGFTVPLNFSSKIINLIDKYVIPDAKAIKIIQCINKSRIYVFNYKNFEFVALGNYLNDKFSIDALYGKNLSDQNIFYSFITDKLWSEYQCNLIEIGKTSIECVQLNSFPSKLADQIYQEIILFENKNYGRSILLYGPPGSGKSKAIANVVSRLNKRTLFFGDNFDDNIEYAKILDPDIIVINDLDHADYNEMFILNFFENFQNKPNKFVLASCNVVHNLDQAIQRPERFDRLIEVKLLDQNVHMQLVNNDKDLFEFTKSFPAVYINEFMKRVNTFGKENALKDSQDLIDRVTNLDKEDYKL